MPAGRSERVEVLDLLRGVAVLGILAINMAGLAGPSAATLSPHLPDPGTFADEAAFAFGFVFFEGKMRALFSMLFGASLLLFIERAEARGRNGDALQLRRLGWLMLFGLAHYFLFWWGDILFNYAVIGVLALVVRREPVSALSAAALLLFASWHLAGTALSLPAVIAEEQVRTGLASGAQVDASQRYVAEIEARAAQEADEARLGFVERARAQLLDNPLQPLENVFWTVGETLPLMLIGMALYRSGFFTGGWPRRRIWIVALGGTGAGLAATLAMLAWLWPRHFPPQAMVSALLYWTALPHLAMALGYAALTVLASSSLLTTALGRRLAAAGRAAFTNYLGTSIVLTAVFYGWGLGLYGEVGRVGQWAMTLLAWALMLAWSRPWLSRFRYGPFEWLWRRLAAGPAIRENSS